MLFPHMDETFSIAAETWLQLLVQEFMCEIANHEIGSPHVKYASGVEARMAMLRLAYLRGRDDALAVSADFDIDVKKVEAANAANVAKR